MSLRDLFRKEPSRPAAGSVWTGFKTYTTDPVIGPPGFYALEDDGYTLVHPPLALTVVNVNPDDPKDERDLTLVAHPDEPYYPQLPPHLNPPNAVELEANVRGTGNLMVGDSNE